MVHLGVINRRQDLFEFRVHSLTLREIGRGAAPNVF
jgi:hypothetical protein